MSKQIDNLAPGSFVELEVDGEDGVEQALFVRTEGTGHERTAVFVQVSDPGGVRGPQIFEWEAYRFNGRWVYGSSAQALRLSAVLVEPCS